MTTLEVIHDVMNHDGNRGERLRKFADTTFESARLLQRDFDPVAQCSSSSGYRLAG
jgi:hypothetical protein